MARLTAVLAITLVGLFTLLVVALQQADEAEDTAHAAILKAEAEPIGHGALKRANAAMHTAETARPNPYTSLHYDRDAKAHAVVHKDEHRGIRELWESKMKVLETDCRARIQALPRPPPEIVAKLEGIEKSVLETHIRQDAMEARIEVLFRRLNSN